MRYSAYLLHIYYDSPLKAIYSGFGTIERYKKRGFKVASEKDGMILMKGNARLEYGKAVLVPETHPLYNEGMFNDGDGAKAKVKDKLNDLMSKAVISAFFSS